MWRVITATGCSQGVQAQTWLSAQRVKFSVLNVDEQPESSLQEHAAQRLWAKQDDVPLALPALSWDQEVCAVGFSADVWGECLQTRKDQRGA